TATIETLKDLAGAAGAEMEFSLPVSSVAVQRMACDCSVTRVLLSQESLVMDVGRAKPIVSSPLRRALKVRDGHCRWPGCERTASKCDGITWCTGSTAVPPSSTTWCCYVAGIIGWCMKADGS